MLTPSVDRFKPKYYFPFEIHFSHRFVVHRWTGWHLLFAFSSEFFSFRVMDNKLPSKLSIDFDHYKFIYMSLKFDFQSMKMVGSLERWFVIFPLNGINDVLINMSTARQTITLFAFVMIFYWIFFFLLCSHLLIMRHQHKPHTHTHNTLTPHNQFSFLFSICEF